LLYLEPERVRPSAVELAGRLRRYDVDAVCGPLVEGAFAALTVATELGVDFIYAERIASAAEGLFPIVYRLTRALREHMRGKRVAIVNDVIAAGSAVRGTLADLRACGAEPAAIGALLVLGDAAERYAAEQGVALERFEARPHAQWEPQVCPLCAAGVPVADLSH
jgi:orotate phosphoribosyltransferase